MPILDEANEKALELMEERGLTYIHPFGDPQLIAGQGTLGLEILEDFPEVQLVIVPMPAPPRWVGGGDSGARVACILEGVS